MHMTLGSPARHGVLFTMRDTTGVARFRHFVFLSYGAPQPQIVDHAVFVQTYRCFGIPGPWVQGNISGIRFPVC